MPEAFCQTVTTDDLLAEFITDMSDVDDVSPSIFTCVDNYIDDLCEQVIQNETSIFENGDLDNGNLPFTYILDRVMEKIDTVDDIANSEYGAALTRSVDDTSNSNRFDPDYCEEINFDEITPEDFQLYINSKDANAGNEDAYCEPQTI